MNKEPTRYYRFEHHQLLELLKNDEIASALCYMLTFTDQHHFEVKANRHCITLCNQETTIAVIFYVGFESYEYDLLRLIPNIELATFCSILPEMLEFENLGVKHIDTIALLNMVLSRSKHSYARRLYNLKRLIT